MCAVLTLSVLAVLAEEIAQVPQGKSVSEFVSPDGRIDLDVVRQSGYQGALDLKGVNVRIDPKTGEPLVAVSNAAVSADSADDVYWDNSISPSIPGVNRAVYALTVYDNHLIAGGLFTTAGGIPASRIAAWNGTSWSALGTGMNREVFALTVYDNKLIAGGAFTTAGGIPASRIAAWNGASWSALGTGMNSSVRALTVYGGLVAGGDFTTAGGDMVWKIAIWDGTGWYEISDWHFGNVRALTVYGAKLIAAGVFHSCMACIPEAGPDATGIAAWDGGSSWSTLGRGLGGNGCDFCDLDAALTVFDNKLIVGGDFKQIGGVPASNIAW